MLECHELQSADPGIEAETLKLENNFNLLFNYATELSIRFVLLVYGVCMCLQVCVYTGEHVQV